jgi:hypothetical protein
MKRLSLLLSLSLLAVGCGDSPAGPPLDADRGLGSSPTLAASPAQGQNAIVEAVSGSGHRTRAIGGYWTFTLHATRSATGEVQGNFQWRVHYGAEGSKVKGDVICFSIEGNQAWLAILFEKAVDPSNIGKWASIWVVDNGEGVNAPADELAMRWRGLPYDPDTNPEGLDPRVFCREKWTDLDIAPIEEGNIQIH